jgi:hypothetical protein
VRPLAAASTCIGALKTKKPVLCQLGRNDDMQACCFRRARSALASCSHRIPSGLWHLVGLARGMVPYAHVRSPKRPCLSAPGARRTATSERRLRRRVRCDFEGELPRSMQRCCPSFLLSAKLVAFGPQITKLALTASVDNGFSELGLAGVIGSANLNAYDLGAVSTLHSKNTISATPTNTIMRAPGDFHAALFMEAAIEAVASAMMVDPIVVQEKNLVAGCLPVWNCMKDGAAVLEVQSSVKAFNSANRWRKRGYYCMPVQYEMHTNQYEEGISVVVNEDGSVSIKHSGIEMGQGINTKVAQAVAMELSLTAPLDLTHLTTVTPKSSADFASATPTWSSGTSEMLVGAAVKACAALNKTASRFKDASRDTWARIASAAVQAGVALSGQASVTPLIDGGTYSVYCTSCCVAEIDVLTGETQILSAQLVFCVPARACGSGRKGYPMQWPRGRRDLQFYDAGESLNPVVDIGQETPPQYPGTLCSN